MDLFQSTDPKARNKSSATFLARGLGLAIRCGENMVVGYPTDADFADGGTLVDSER